VVQKKQISVFQMTIQQASKQASKQLAVLMVCAVFRHIGKIAKSNC